MPVGYEQGLPLPKDEKMYSDVLSAKIEGGREFVTRSGVLGFGRKTEMVEFPLSSLVVSRTYGEEWKYKEEHPDEFNEDTKKKIMEQMLFLHQNFKDAGEQ